MATTSKKQSRDTVQNFRTKAQEINKKALQFSDNLVEESLATGAEWQAVFAKAVKSGTILLGKQQDLALDTLEGVKAQYLKGNKRFRKLIDFGFPKKEKTAKATTKTAKAPVTAKSIANKVAQEDATLKPVKKAQAKSNLKLIEGIGPKLETILNEAGILTFDHLAKAQPAKIKAILVAANPRYKMHDPTTWTKQAQLANAGKLKELKALQAELKGGKA